MIDNFCNKKRQKLHGFKAALETNPSFISLIPLCCEFQCIRLFKCKSMWVSTFNYFSSTASHGSLMNTFVASRDRFKFENANFAFDICILRVSRDFCKNLVTFFREFCVRLVIFMGIFMACLVAFQLAYCDQHNLYDLFILGLHLEQQNVFKFSRSRGK